MPLDRPRGLTVTTWLMALLNPLGFASVDWSEPFVWLVSQVVVISLLILTGYVALFYYWRGHNWARWMVMLSSVVALANLAYWASSDWVTRLMVGLEAPLGLFLLYWLNTPSAKAYFLPSPQSACDPATEPRPSESV